MDIKIKKGKMEEEAAEAMAAGDRFIFVNSVLEAIDPESKQLLKLPTCP